jgi:hypothetical protein
MWVAPILIATALSFAETGQNNKDIARGKYLVEEVAMCQECHTPRDASGVIFNNG